jgi:hypothetical protein
MALDRLYLNKSVSLPDAQDHLSVSTKERPLPFDQIVLESSFVFLSVGQQEHPWTVLVVIGKRTLIVYPDVF